MSAIAWQARENGKATLVRELKPRNARYFDANSVRQSGFVDNYQCRHGETHPKLPIRGPNMKQQEAEILFSILRRTGSIMAFENDRLRRKARSTRHPLGQRFFRRKMRIWPAERRQMSYVVELREQGHTWDEVYFTFLRERRRNLRNGHEISRGRLQNMYEAEMDLRIKEGRYIGTWLLYWYRQGFTLETIADLADDEDLIPYGWATLDDIRELIAEEERIQESKRDGAN